MRFPWSLPLASLVVLASLAYSAAALAQRLPPVHAIPLDTANGVNLAQHQVSLPVSANAESAQPSAPAGISPVAGWDEPGTADVGYESSGGSFTDEFKWSQTGVACDQCPNRGLVAFVSYDSWKGRPDRGWQNNGIVAGLNFGTRLGRISDWTGVGFQIGASAAAYNWSGTDFRTRNNDQAEPQGFLTYGLFRKANENSNWSAAVVQDWMFNSNFSVFGQNPTLSQWRGQLGYALSAKNEIGIWGAWRSNGDSRLVDPTFGTVSYSAVNQLSVFFHRKWSPGGADTSLWVGVPEHGRLGGSGSLGDYLIGLSASVPLSNAVGLYTMVNYMHPSASAGAAGFDDEAWNFTIGLTFYPRRNARSTTVADQCWMPMMLVANNGLFMTDSSKTY
jgi:hypothetical protein